jgi:hypothetical protein
MGQGKMGSILRKTTLPEALGLFGEEEEDPNRPKRRRLARFAEILQEYQDKERERFDRGQAMLTQLANANLNVAGLYA